MEVKWGNKKSRLDDMLCWCYERQRKRKNARKKNIFYIHLFHLMPVQQFFVASSLFVIFIFMSLSFYKSLGFSLRCLKWDFNWFQMCVIFGTITWISRTIFRLWPFSVKQWMEIATVLYNDGYWWPIDWVPQELQLWSSQTNIHWVSVECKRQTTLDTKSLIRSQ